MFAKNIVITLISLLFCLTSFAASRDSKKTKVEIPDMEKIQEAVCDPASKYYYPKLFESYESIDTSMQLDGYRHLYFGYMFQEDYNPYRRSEFSQKIEHLYYKPKHTRAECDSIIKYAELSLHDNPFDLQQMNFLIYAMRERGKINKANIWQYRLNHILEAIVSSGTGQDEENAWFVIIPQNEYMLINSMGYVADSHEFINPFFDYITVTNPKEKKSAKDKDKTTEGFYFNIKNILEEYYRKFPDEE